MRSTLNWIGIILKHIRRWNPLNDMNGELASRFPRLHMTTALPQHTRYTNSTEYALTPSTLNALRRGMQQPSHRPIQNHHCLRTFYLWSHLLPPLISTMILQHHPSHLTIPSLLLHNITVFQLPFWDFHTTPINYVSSRTLLLPWPTQAPTFASLPTVHYSCM